MHCHVSCKPCLFFAHSAAKNQAAMVPTYGMMEFHKNWASIEHKKMAPSWQVITTYHLSLLSEILKDHVRNMYVVRGTIHMLPKDPTKVGLIIVRVTYKYITMVKNEPKAAKNVQQKCHIKLIFAAQRYLGRVGPQPSNLMKEE
jgi:hypothetical protein